MLDMLCCSFEREMNEMADKSEAGTSEIMTKDKTSNVLICI
jgi:hypothetical protein